MSNGNCTHLLSGGNIYKENSSLSLMQPFFSIKKNTLEIGGTEGSDDVSSMRGGSLTFGKGDIVPWPVPVPISTTAPALAIFTDLTGSSPL